ncbi:MAG: hypothetical protein ACFB6S_06525 [Geminicoccaceae bacterium]
MFLSGALWVRLAKTSAVVALAVPVLSSDLVAAAQQAPVQGTLSVRVSVVADPSHGGETALPEDRDRELAILNHQHMMRARHYARHQELMRREFESRLSRSR